MMITELPGNRVREAADVTARAFLKEGFIRRFFDTRDTRTPKLLQAFFSFQIELFSSLGVPALAAFEGEELLGAALIKPPALGIGTFLSRGILKEAVKTFFPLKDILNWKDLPDLFLLTKEPRGIPSPHYTLEALAVDPAHQGRGIGRKLLIQVAERWGDKGAGIYLYTADEKNRDLYLSMGYRLLREKKLDRLGIKAYYMFLSSPNLRASTCL